jgi:hypothetical protein
MSLAALAGVLHVTPGALQPLRCERPVAAPELLRRLIGRAPPERVPGLLATLFSVCGEAHALTARRALDTARGVQRGKAHAANEAALLRACTLRDHLLRLALELPRQVDGSCADAGWLRSRPGTGRLAEQEDAHERAQAWAAYVEQQLFGGDARSWRAVFAAEGSAGVARWARTVTHPVARWLHGVRSESAELMLRPLIASPAVLREIAEGVRQSASYAASPTLGGAPAETGPFCREGAQARDAFDLLGARVAELARLCEGSELGGGALALADGEALAYTEMARGLLVHWVKLGPGAEQVEDFRVVAPTAWSFHPRGALAQRLRDPTLRARQRRLLVAALDPCLEVRFHDERRARDPCMS